MLGTSIQLRERFCKDCNIPLKLYQSPYFEERLKLYDPFYGTMEKWDIFLKELEKYKCEQDYFEDYNRVKEAAITSIKNTVSFEKFNTENMDIYSISNSEFPNHDIFSSLNDSKTFISIDMCKANFSALSCYYPEMFVGKSGMGKSWEEFISIFTDNKHIINSKYIRQVILGNCNPRRQSTIEKHIMDEILSYLLSLLEPDIKKDSVVFFSNDEIVIDVSENGYGGYVKAFISKSLSQISRIIPIPLKIELFTLHVIPGTSGYYKEIHGKNGEVTYELKCLDSYVLPFVLRKFRGEEVEENDKVFYHNGALAKYIEIPQVELGEIQKCQV